MTTATKPLKKVPDPFSLGLNVTDSLLVHQALLAGLPFSSFVKFETASKLARARLASIISVAPRTLDRRQKEKRLKSDESERLFRVANLYRLATELFNGDEAAAAHWMEAPRPALGGIAPLELARTEVGGRRVETLIGQLEHGVYV